MDRELLRRVLGDDKSVALVNQTVAGWQIADSVADGTSVIVDRAHAEELWKLIAEYGEQSYSLAIAEDRALWDVDRIQTEIDRLASKVRATIGLEPIP